MAHSPHTDLTSEGKVIAPEYRETKQTAVHLARYHQEMADHIRNHRNFSNSKQVRRLLDALLYNMDVEVPEYMIVDSDQVEGEVIDTYVSESAKEKTVFDKI